MSQSSGSGDDKVSDANFTTGQSFEVNASGEVVIIGGGGFSGYKVDSTTIKIIQLTNFDDTFSGDYSTNINIDGGANCSLSSKKNSLDNWL